MSLAAPLRSAPIVIAPDWGDYNGHMNMGFYAVLVDRFLDLAFLAAGLGADYAAARGLSTFAAELHLRYLREVRVGQAVVGTALLVDADDKRLHVAIEILDAAEGWVSATAEVLSLHVDLTARRVVPFPPEAQARVEALLASHAAAPRPGWLGRAIAMRRGASPDRSPAASG